MPATRTTDGRFLSRRCPDPHCDGSLVLETEQAWRGGPSYPVYRCDGLTHLTDTSPLFACAVSFPAPTKDQPHD